MRKRNSSEVLVINSKVKDYIRKNDLHSSGDLAEALTEVVIHHLDKAIKRAKANGRKTVRSEDL